MEKGPDAFRTISEVAEDLGLPQHVLRFWETRFGQIKPLKRGGGRRYYRPDDVELLRGIRHLLYGEGYTIRGVQQILREQGVRHVQSIGLAVEAEDAGKISHSAPALADTGRVAEEEPGEPGARSRSGLIDLLPSLRPGRPAPELPRVVEMPVPQPAPPKETDENMPPFPFRRSQGPIRPAEPVPPPFLMRHAPAPETSAARSAPAKPVVPAAPAPVPAGAKFSPEAVRLLKSTLYELGECQRTLDAARRKSS